MHKHLFLFPRSYNVCLYGIGYGWVFFSLLLSHDVSRNTKKSGSMNLKVSILLLYRLSAIIYLMPLKKQRIFVLQPAEILGLHFGSILV
jgi:hypothetical protein